MARVALIDLPSDVGDVWNVRRALANSTALLGALVEFFSATRERTLLPPRTREAVILRCGALCGCEYEWRRHVLLARQAGLEDDEIRRSRADVVTDFAASELAAIRLASAVEPRERDEDVWSEARNHFDDSQLVEIVGLSAQYSLMCRILLALDIDLDPDILDVSV